ncbi:MAG: glycosyltransferase [Cyanobacteria bacterium P01_H01_bin.105]
MCSNTLKFSIIIPTYNRPNRLELCLQSIAQLNYPSHCFEVIIVDDGSHMPLNPITEKFTSSLPLRLIQQQNAGPASARNTGAASAQGNYLVFTDDDCQPASDWLMSLSDAYQKVPNALVGGRTINALPNNLYSTASQLLIDYIYDYYNQTPKEATFFASNNFAMPRTLYQQLQGFDTSFPLAAGEDREFCDRWRHHGFPMHYAPAMQLNHAHMLTLGSFWQQHVNYGRGAFHFHRVRSQRHSQPMQVEPFAFYFRLLTYPFTRHQGKRALSLSALFFLSQVANVVGFAWEKYKQHSLASPVTAISSS